MAYLEWRAILSVPCTALGQFEEVVALLIRTSSRGKRQVYIASCSA